MLVRLNVVPLPNVTIALVWGGTLGLWAVCGWQYAVAFAAGAMVGGIRVSRGWTT